MTNPNIPTPDLAGKPPFPQLPIQINAQSLIDKLKEKWQGRPCPMCQSGNWNITPNVFELREFLGGNLNLGSGPILPVIPVTCNNCGNVVFLNALATGLIPQPKSEGK